MAENKIKVAQQKLAKAGEELEEFIKKNCNTENTNNHNDNDNDDNDNNNNNNNNDNYNNNDDNKENTLPELQQSPNQKQEIPCCHLLQMNGGHNISTLFYKVPDVALVKASTVSSTPYFLSNLFDGNENTEWITKFPESEISITFCGGDYFVRAIKIYPAVKGINFAVKAIPAKDNNMQISLQRKIDIPVTKYMFYLVDMECISIKIQCKRNAVKPWIGLYGIKLQMYD